MRSSNETVRRLTQRAMERHGLNQRELAWEMGCGLQAVAHLLDEENVRLNQEQWVVLMKLGGIKI